MIDERAFIARVEATSTEQFSNNLLRPSTDEERALRVYFGDVRYERLHALATKSAATRGLRAPRGNVLVLHGILGGELTVRPQGEREQQIWMNIPRLNHAASRDAVASRGDIG